MTNIEYFTSYERQGVYTHDGSGFEGFAEFERDWLTNRALRFYEKHTIDEVLTARRPAETHELTMESFKKFDVPRHDIIRDEHFYKALDLTRQWGQPNRKLHPVAFPDLRYYPWNLPPNAEAPWNLPKFRFKPVFRNIDGESESPKLMEYFNRDIKMKLIYDIRGSVTITDYLKCKYKAGLIDSIRPTFHNLYNEIFIRNRFLVHEIKDGRHPFWDQHGNPVPYYFNTLHIKTTVVEANAPDKIRLVFGAPKLLLQVENMFIWPLQATYLNTGTGFLLWGREMVRGGWKKIQRELDEIDPRLVYFGADWKSWDKRLSFELQSEVHNIWRSYYDFTMYEPTSQYQHGSTKPERIERLWKWMTYCILHTPIRLPDGLMARWIYSGFGSGYQQTQLMDSFGNHIVTLTCLSSMGIDIERTLKYLKVQGDDIFAALMRFVYYLFGSTFKTKFADAADFYFGMVLDMDATFFTLKLGECSVLSYSVRHGRPYRTEVDLLRHLFFPKSGRDWAH
uniref:RNA-dependent RNA polymerase n=1 Tax=Ceratobasidium partitivirus TaxID=1905681 RepID=A0A219WGI8_9VIRU|nr:RNA-dependent RNA polymerase [Ceratobasidium partitivirus]